ncbi:MAG TPA: hypothetical protein VNI77_07740 [Nitrososphaera sp.]|nr:hypothetical protein [Nitrososphaera sp.]
MSELKKEGVKIVRIMGEGQYTVDSSTLNRLNEIDNEIVTMIADGKGPQDSENFRKKLAELTEIVSKNGKPVDAKEIVESDIILPGPDTTVEEARQIFKGEGVIPDNLLD